MEKSIVKFLEESLRSNWKENALSDLQGETLTYEQLAISVAKLHLSFKACGVERGDKVAIVGSTVLRVGYRNTIERSWVNNLDTQIVTHMAVIGVGGEWISLGGNKPNGEKARIISAMY